MRCVSLLLIAALILPGCAFGPRQYTYDVDLRNTADRPITLELLQTQSSSTRKSRADLAPGGAYCSCFTGYGPAEYLEARLRYTDDPADAPWYIEELPEGQIRADIQSVSGRLSVHRRSPTPPDAPYP